MEKVLYGFKLLSEKKGYYEVLFYDDNGRNLNHWLSGNQIFRNREDAKNYIEKVKEWNVFRFTQTLIVLH